MTLLAQVAFTASDWLAFAGLVAAQTAALGTVIWRVASRIQTIETKVDMLLSTEIAGVKDRLARLERVEDERS